MLIDLMLTTAGILSMVGYALRRDVLSAFVWAVIGAYAFGNYQEKRRR